MKQFLPGLLFLMSAGCTSVTAAPDISGIWTLQMERDFRGDPDVSVDCTFQQRRNALTVKCGSGIEMDGEVRGRSVSWGLEKTVRIPPMTTEDRLVLVHTARLNAEGTRLTGTWRLTSSVVDTSGNFEARKKEP